MTDPLTPEELAAKYGTTVPTVPATGSTTTTGVPAMPWDSAAPDMTALPVFWGWTRSSTGGIQYGPGGIYAGGGIDPELINLSKPAGRVPETKTVAEASEWFVNLPLTDPKLYEQYRVLMEDAGLVTREAGQETAAERWQEFITQAAAVSQQTGKQLTPEQWLTKLADPENAAAGADGSGSGSPAPFTGDITTVNKSVETYSPSELRPLAEDTWAAAMGRAPTKAERQELRSDINERSRSNPVVSKSTTSFVDGESTGTSTVTNGGANPTQIALNEARSKEGYGEYQALGYFDAMMSALAAPGAG